MKDPSAQSQISRRGSGALVVGILLLLLLLPGAAVLYACAHSAQHALEEDQGFFSVLLLPITLTNLWLLWMGVVLVRRLPPGPRMRVPGAIGFAVTVTDVFLNVWRFFSSGYHEDQAFAMLYLAPAVAIGLASVGNMLDDGKSKSARTFYVLAPIGFIGWIGLALAWNQATRG